MNKNLIGCLDVINQLLAILITLAGAAAGYSYANYYNPLPFPRMMGMLVGGSLGFICAAVICGLLATVLEIERHLRVIAAKGSSSPSN